METTRIAANAKHWGLVLEPLTEKREIWAGSSRIRETAQLI